MAQLQRLQGEHRDIPFLRGDRAPAAIAGTGTDYEINILAVPDLTKLPFDASGESGMLPIDNLYLRDVILMPEATVTGQATNYYVLLFRQWRAGVVVNQVNTTCPASITVGANTLTPAAMTNIEGPSSVYPVSLLYVSGGTGTAEYVIVTATTATTFTATFANTHSGAYTIMSTHLAAVIYNASGVTEAVNTPRQLNCLPAALKPGDVVTVQRLSFGTGLASPAMTIQLDYELEWGTAISPHGLG